MAYSASDREATARQPAPSRRVTVTVLPPGFMSTSGCMQTGSTTSDTTPTPAPTPLPLTQSQILYRVKIINPAKKTDMVVRDMRTFHSHFSSMTDMKVRLMEEFKSQVPATTSFSMGYFAGRPSAKYWIYTEEDLASMYSKSITQEIMLWCDGRNVTDSETPNPKRRKTGEGCLSRREEKELEVEELTKELKELNKEKLNLSEVQYRLWARMITTGIHSSKDTPPQVPMITGITPKRKQRKDDLTMSDTIASTAAAVVKAINCVSPVTQSATIQQTILDSCTPTRRSNDLSQLGISPGKASEIRGKSFGQLSTLKQLYDDCVLTQDEFEEQKRDILFGLKRLQ